MFHLRERLLGTPEKVGTEGLHRILRRGDDGLRVRALRVLSESGASGVVGLLIKSLQDPVPAMRAAAARGLGWHASGIDALRLADDRVQALLQDTSQEDRRESVLEATTSGIYLASTDEGQTAAACAWASGDSAPTCRIFRH